MSAMLADIDATCASLGYYDGAKYIPEPDALQGLKVELFQFYIKKALFKKNKNYFSI